MKNILNFAVPVVIVGYCIGLYKAHQRRHSTSKFFATIYGVPFVTKEELGTTT